MNHHTILIQHVCIFHSSRTHLSACLAIYSSSVHSDSEDGKVESAVNFSYLEQAGKNGVARELAYGTMATPVYVHVLTREILRINLLSLAIKESIQVGHFKVFQNRVY